MCSSDLITEKISYIKGLTEGLKLDENKDEVKVINAIIDLLDDMAASVTDIEDVVEEMGEQLDAVDEDLADLEQDFEDVLEDDCDCGCGCDDDCDFDDDDEEYYEVTCPNCGEEIVVEEEILLCGETECPKCGEVLEFDFSALEDDDCECGCCCGSDNSKEDLMS